MHFCATFASANACAVCEDGYHLIPDTGLCTETCPDGYYQDSDNGVCRYTCNDDEYFDPEDPTACLPCGGPETGDGAIRDCMYCGEEAGVGSQVLCAQCDAPFVPSVDGLSCIHANCEGIDAVDKNICLECSPGYYMNWDTTRCVQ